MKVTVFILTCLAFAAATSIGLKTQYKGADKNFAQKQKFLYEILRHVQQPLYDTEYEKDSHSYVQGEEYYTQYGPVYEFFKINDYGLLPRDAAYSILNEKHLKETVGLFHLFYYSKDWTTFYKNVLWARQHVNPEMFVYALSVAVAHRDDCEGIVLPAPYEIQPYKFHNMQTIRDALNVKMQNLQKIKNYYTVWNRYTVDNHYINEEAKLAYFMEDIGLNTYYYNNHIDRPFFMGAKQHGLTKERRGELFLYMHQQLLARFYLERLSNKLGRIPTFSWLKPIATGYNPQLSHQNGLGYSFRKNYYEVASTHDYEHLNKIYDYERRIRDIIDNGYYVTPSGKTIDFRNPQSVNELGNIIESNEDSVNKYYFGMLTQLASVILGGSNAKEDYYYSYNYMPSALENYETALRDPVFYQMYKRILKNYYKYKNYLQPYKYEDLYYPGVKIQDVKVTKLVTYFDNFDADITNAVYVQGMGNQYSYENYVNRYSWKYYGKNRWIDYLVYGNKYENHYNNYPQQTKYQPQESFKQYPSQEYYKNFEPSTYPVNKNFNYKQEGIEHPEYSTSYKGFQGQKSFEQTADFTGTTKQLRSEDSDFVIKARHMRLNHKPFTVSIDVLSEKQQKVVARVFLGPKYDNFGNFYNLVDNRDNFVEIDQSVHEIPTGKVTINIESRYFRNVRRDYTTYYDLYKQVLTGFQGNAEDFTYFSGKECGFPNRLVLPKGWEDGMPLQVFVIITPYYEGASQMKDNGSYKYGLCDNLLQGRTLDNRPLGFPFDRRIDQSQFNVPNAWMKDVYVYHQTRDTITNVSDFDSQYKM